MSKNRIKIYIINQYWGSCFGFGFVHQVPDTPLVYIFGKPNRTMLKGYDTSGYSFKTHREAISIAKLFLEYLDLTPGKIFYNPDLRSARGMAYDKSMEGCIKDIYTNILKEYWDFYLERYTLK